MNHIPQNSIDKISEQKTIYRKLKSEFGGAFIVAGVTRKHILKRILKHIVKNVLMDMLSINTFS